MEVMQMDKRNIYDFQAAAAGFNFKSVPFTRVKSIRLDSDLSFHVSFKVSFDEGTHFEETNISRETRTAGARKRVLPIGNLLKRESVLSDKKRKGIESMPRFMPACEASFMDHLCKVGSQRKNK